MSVVIGVMPLFDEEKNSIWMLPNYLDGIINAGGIPLIFPLTDNKDILLELINKCDGILLTGGQDVNPKLYHEEKSIHCGKPLDIRDEMEMYVISEALKKDLSILGICRGHQILNVYCNGSLYQDIYSEKEDCLNHSQTPPYDKPIHSVKIVKDSFLSKIINKDELMVNSYHHQAIKSLGNNLIPLAYSSDGIVEAMMLDNKKFCLSVQWHPEYMESSSSENKAIFKYFIKSCLK